MKTQQEKQHLFSAFQWLLVVLIMSGIIAISILVSAHHSEHPPKMIPPPQPNKLIMTRITIGDPSFQKTTTNTKQVQKLYTFLTSLPPVPTIDVKHDPGHSCPAWGGATYDLSFYDNTKLLKKVLWHPDFWCSSVIVDSIERATVPNGTDISNTIMTTIGQEFTVHTSDIYCNNRHTSNETGMYFTC